MPAARPPPSAPPVRTQPQPPPEGPQVDAPVPAPPPAASSTGRKTAKKRKPAGEAGAAADEPLKKRRSSKIVPPDGIVSQHKGVSWVQKVKKWQASIWLMPEVKMSRCGIASPELPSATTPMNPISAFTPRSAMSARNVYAKYSPPYAFL